MDAEGRIELWGRRELLASTGLAAAARAAARPRAGNLDAAGNPARVDCQSHIYPPELLDLMEKRTASPRVYRQGGDRFVVVGDWVRRILQGEAEESRTH